MSEHPHLQRQSAAAAFVQSLEQLEAVLQPEVAAASSPSPAAPSAAAPEPADPVGSEAGAGASTDKLARAFEAAAADIEQYMNARQR